jgi:putative hydrolase of the HAD superfamily
MADYERGLVSTENFIREILPFCAAGTTEQQIIDAWMSMLSDLPAERLAFIDSLREKGHKVYLLSNGNDLHFHYINDRYHLDSCFERMFLSQEMHIAKPEKEIYEQVEAAIRPRTAVEDERQPEVIFVDDLPQNRLAAEQTAGWKTCASLNGLKQVLG